MLDYDHGYPPGGMNSIEWDKLPDLAELIVGKVRGRQSDNETTCFNNSVGFGVQFTAVGGIAFELDTLEATQGKLAETARRLGISRTTLWRRLREYGLKQKNDGFWRARAAS